MKAYIYDDNDNETEVELKGYVSKYHPAVMYLKNGDPGYPEEGGDLEDFSVCLGDKDITNTLDEKTTERLEMYFRENWETDDRECEDNDE